MVSCRFRFIPALAVLTAISTPAWAQSRAEPGFYLAGGLGYIMNGSMTLEDLPDVDRDHGMLAVGAVGYDMGMPRFEAELGWQGLGGQDDTDISVWSAMINGYIDFPTGTRFTPYLGAGVGVATVYFNGTIQPGSISVDDEDQNFAFQFMGGVGYTLNRNFEIYGGYRYFNVIDTRYLDNSRQTIKAKDTESHNFELGLRYRF